MPLFRRLLLIQGAYYALTGLWPLVSIKTFQRVTGPKNDLWLVKTAGLLILAVAVPLLAAGAGDHLSPEIVLLSAGSAVALAGVDVVYAFKGVISRVYLLDAAAEAALLISWAYAIAG